MEDIKKDLEKKGLMVWHLKNEEGLLIRDIKKRYTILRPLNVYQKMLSK